MLSKCSAFGKKDDIAQIEKIPACSENRVSEKALLQFICSRGFDIYPIKILLTISLVLGKNKGKLQSCSLDLPYQETAIYMLPKRRPSQNSRVQNANLCHKFQFGNFNLRCTVNFHFASRAV